MNTISMPGVSASQPPGTSPSPQAPLALPAPPPLTATPYLQIVGMLTAEVLADDEEYSEVCPCLCCLTVLPHQVFLQAWEGCDRGWRQGTQNLLLQVIEDIQEECGKYGKITAIVVPRPADPSTAAQVFGQGNFGKVFTDSDPKDRLFSETWFNQLACITSTERVFHDRPCQRCLPSFKDQNDIKLSESHYSSMQAFVHFEDSSSCQKSKDAVHGRLFAGVSLQASFITAKDFEGLGA